MGKREYLKPEIEIIAIEAELQMMTISPGTQPGIGKGEADDSTPLSNGRRGTWGNLWSDNF